MKTIIKSLLLISILLLTNSAFAAPDWNSVSTLIKNQKITQAYKQVDVILNNAKRAKDVKNWRQALIIGAVMREKTGQFENAVRYLSSHPWPQDAESQMLINLHKAYLLSSFVRRYRWEIQNRERVKSNKKQGLKKKTMAQLVAEINQAYAKAYTLASKQDEPLRKYRLQLTNFKNYFSLPNYPAQVRGNTRDTVAYLWVDFLQDSSLWKAGQSAQSVSLRQLLSITYKNNLAFAKKVQPLKRIAWILSDLEQYELSQKKPEAAMEAFRVKIEKIAQFKSNPNEIKQLSNALQQRIAANKTLPWSNMLRNTQANLLARTGADDRNIRRVAILEQCIAQHPKHQATTFCKAQLLQVKKPSIQLVSMQTDGLKKRSIQITHNNVKRLYFRAWRLSLQEVLQNKTQQQMRNYLIKNSRKPNAQWQANLPPGQNYLPHKTYITPPLTQYGYWLIGASLMPDFSIHNKKNVIASSTLNLSRLVANARNVNGSQGQMEVTVYNGETGQVANNIRSEIWTQDYNRPSQLLSTAVTSGQGTATIKLNQNKQYRLILKNQNGSDFTLVDGIHAYSNPPERPIKNALVFTDRAIYRPGQKVLWKVVAYRGMAKTGKYSVLANSTGWVKLFDANGKLVKQQPVKTNQFGSASGEFIAKTGLLLGHWSIRTSWGSNQSIKVEEYKRPTFTVKIENPKQSLALNKPAQVIGTAKYYFGGAVSKGKLKWRVTRQAIDLWRYGGHGGNLSAVTIASGSAKVDTSGRFIMKFVPKSPNPAAFKGLEDSPKQFTFSITAELTDSGGETRKASRSFTVGKLGISADISQEQNFAIAGKPFALTVQRKDLNGTPRPGTGFWQVYQVQQPAKPVLPADIPVKTSSRYATPGDKLSPRWASIQQAYSLDNTARDWKDGRKVLQGAVKHDSSGEAKIAINKLGAGLYRLRYTSKDRWGQVYKTNKVFVVAQQNRKTAAVPALLMAQNNSVEVGQSVSLLAGSAFANVHAMLDIYHGNKLLRRSILNGGIKQINFPVSEQYRGGLTFILTSIKDYQLVRQQQFVSVPWTNKQLNVSFSTFRDKLQPGQKEKWRITVKDAKNKPLAQGAAEVLASMYDRSLDLFVPHNPATIAALYSQQMTYLNTLTNLGTGQNLYAKYNQEYIQTVAYQAARLILVSSNQFEEALPVLQSEGAPMPSPVMRAPMRRAAPRAAVDVVALQGKLIASGDYKGPVNGIVTDKTRDALKRFMNKGSEGNKISQDIPGNSLGNIKSRTNFNETAFFYPHLILEKNGSVTFEFEVPESLTQWKVWARAISKDLRGGAASEFASTSKELMVRPYLPRFLRAGDQANIEVLINNGGDKALSGKLDFDILDPVTLKSIKTTFKLGNTLRNFSVKAGQSSRQRFAITAPNELGLIAIRARASATNSNGKFSDGEQRPLPVLPSRIHLSQSRFAALKGKTTRHLQFKELTNNTDKTRINDRLVVTIDGQLFYSTLNALPYLVNYPYECTEQTMNRFLSSSIINSVFKSHPAIASMAKKMAKRKTRLEKWDSVDKDPNRKMLLEETPWLNQAQGGNQKEQDLIPVLDPKVARLQTQKALLKLRKAQKASGGFPWWEGGRESLYMTTYLLHGFSRALEFKVAIPKDMVQKAWRYVNKEYNNKLRKKLKSHLSEITLINYVLSAYPDVSWTGGAFSSKDRAAMLNYSFKHWRTLSPLLKAYLALTLKRAGRTQDAMLIFDALMDTAKTDPDLGTYWAPEDRSWLWYNDNVDTHAFMLRTMMELNPNDKRREGLVQWLMLNKKLSHWKSTRATAESIYALVHYLKKENQLDKEERATVKIGNHLSKQFIFKPDEYTGAKNQVVVKGAKIKADMANINIANQSKSLMFASATWHFSTEKLPKQASGDFFSIKRQFFKRVHKGKQWQLLPLQEGATLKVGDQLEVQLSLRNKHAAEYVHLRAPRGAGFEPEALNSGYRWDTGIGYYQETRDSGTNYFFDWLPAGQYTFKYRLRATTAGKFRVAPASVQSIYAPEFNAYSSGKRLNIQ